MVRQSRSTAELVKAQLSRAVAFPKMTRRLGFAVVGLDAEPRNLTC